jgi:putative flippase GtrA
MMRKNDELDSLENSNSQHSLRFLSVGFWNTCFSLGLFTSLLKFVPELNVQVVLFITFSVGTLQSHFMQRNLVWKSTASYKVEFNKFLLTSALLYLCNAFLLEFASRYTSLSHLQIQVVVTFLLVVSSFFIQKFFVFRAM